MNTMKTMRRPRWARPMGTIAAALVLGAGLAVSCSGGEDDTAPTSVVETAASLSERAADAMAAVESLHFSITRSGASVALDPAGLLMFESAEGRYGAPSSADALITVTALGNRLEVGAIAIDGRLWVTEPLTGRWDEATDLITFDPAALFGAEQGLPAVLRDGLSDTEVVHPVDARGRIQLRGLVGADEVASLVNGMAATEAIVDFWIDAETARVHELRFETGAGDAIASWVIQLDDFDGEVTITPPELGTGD